MKALEEIYKPSFFKQRHKLSWRAPVVVNAVMLVLDNFKTVIDVGCATGDLIREFICCGKEAYGIEGSAAVLPYLEVLPERVMLHDLREPLKWKGKLDLCLCLEVAEHIEPEHAETFVESLCSLSDQLLMSIAGPGQGGHYHVNCQPLEYWNKLFKKHGYEQKPEIAKALKICLQRYKNRPGIKAYYYNFVFYGKANQQ